MKKYELAEKQVNHLSKKSDMTIKENIEFVENLKLNEIESLFRLRFKNIKKEKGPNHPETKKAYKEWFGFYNLTMAEILKIWQNG